MLYNFLEKLQNLKKLIEVEIGIERAKYYPVYLGKSYKDFIKDTDEKTLVHYYLGEIAGETLADICRKFSVRKGDACVYLANAPHLKIVNKDTGEVKELEPGTLLLVSKVGRWKKLPHINCYGLVPATSGIPYEFRIFNEKEKVFETDLWRLYFDCEIYDLAEDEDKFERYVRKNASKFVNLLITLTGEKIEVEDLFKVSEEDISRYREEEEEIFAYDVRSHIFKIFDVFEKSVQELGEHIFPSRYLMLKGEEYELVGDVTKELFKKVLDFVDDLKKSKNLERLKDFSKKLQKGEEISEDEILKNLDTFEDLVENYLKNLDTFRDSFGKKKREFKEKIEASEQAKATLKQKYELGLLREALLDRLALLTSPSFEASLEKFFETKLGKRLGLERFKRYLKTPTGKKYFGKLLKDILDLKGEAREEYIKKVPLFGPLLIAFLQIVSEKILGKDVNIEQLKSISTSPIFKTVLRNFLEEYLHLEGWLTDPKKYIEKFSDLSYFLLSHIDMFSEEELGKDFDLKKLKEYLGSAQGKRELAEFIIKFLGLGYKEELQAFGPFLIAFVNIFSEKIGEFYDEYVKKQQPEIKTAGSKIYRRWVKSKAELTKFIRSVIDQSLKALKIPDSLILSHGGKKVESDILKFGSKVQASILRIGKPLEKAEEFKLSSVFSEILTDKTLKEEDKKNLVKYILSDSFVKFLSTHLEKVKDIRREVGEVVKNIKKKQEVKPEKTYSFIDKYVRNYRWLYLLFDVPIPNKIIFVEHSKDSAVNILLKNNSIKFDVKMLEELRQKYKIDVLRLERRKEIKQLRTLIMKLLKGEKPLSPSKVWDILKKSDEEIAKNLERYENAFKAMPDDHRSVELSAEKDIYLLKIPIRYMSGAPELVYLPREITIPIYFEKDIKVSVTPPKALITGKIMRESREGVYSFKVILPFADEYYRFSVEVDKIKGVKKYIGEPNWNKIKKKLLKLYKVLRKRNKESLAELLYPDDLKAQKFFKLEFEKKKQKIKEFLEKDIDYIKNNWEYEDWEELETGISFFNKIVYKIKSLVKKVSKGEEYIGSFKVILPVADRVYDFSIKIDEQGRIEYIKEPDWDDVKKRLMSLYNGVLYFAENYYKLAAELLYPGDSRAEKLLEINLKEKSEKINEFLKKGIDYIKNNWRYEDWEKFINSINFFNEVIYKINVAGRKRLSDKEIKELEKKYGEYFKISKKIKIKPAKIEEIPERKKEEDKWVDVPPEEEWFIPSPKDSPSLSLWEKTVELHSLLFPKKEWTKKQVINYLKVTGRKFLKIEEPDGDYIWVKLTRKRKNADYRFGKNFWVTKTGKTMRPLFQIVESLQTKTFDESMDKLLKLQRLMQELGIIQYLSTYLYSNLGVTLSQSCIEDAFQALADYLKNLRKDLQGSLLRDLYREMKDG